ncbi:MAG: YaaA family protein [Muribaculaceae bacterium]
MQIILSCAKIMTEPGEAAAHALSTPAFMAQAMQFAADMTHLSVDDIAQALHCSRAIAAATALRFRQFFDPTPGTAAILTYHGQAYKALRANELTSQDLLFAQDHLWITSFLYGMLRPLDAIHPYRMEGNVCLPSAGGQNLFAYWRELLTEQLINSVKASGGVLLHLATEEMQHLFNWTQVTNQVTVVQPQFLVRTGNKYKVVTVYAKSCRGAMTRHVITNRLTSPQQITDFTYQGFCHNPQLSSEGKPAFTLE